MAPITIGNNFHHIHFTILNGVVSFYFMIFNIGTKAGGYHHSQSKSCLAVKRLLCVQDPGLNQFFMVLCRLAIISWFDLH